MACGLVSVSGLTLIRVHQDDVNITRIEIIMIGNVIKDLQYSLRMLVKSPLFSTIAILTLALGIGLNAATFSAVHGLLLRPLGGVADPEVLVQVYRQWPCIE